MKTVFVFLILQFSLFVTPIFASESFFSEIDKSLFFTLGPKIMVNTDDSTKSAPSPVMYSLGAGGDFIFKNGISLETQLSFFTNYYLWDGEDSQPAEVENRTATALSFMMDFTGGYTFTLGKEKNHLLSVLLGSGILLRHAFLSNGVDSDDTNRATGSKASDDVSNINGTFFSNMNFFYPEISLAYSYILSPVWKVGIETRVYLPAGSLSNDKGLDNMIVSLAAKLSYK